MTLIELVVSQNEIAQVFKILDIFRTASPFPRVQNNARYPKYIEYFKKKPILQLIVLNFRHS